MLSLTSASTATPRAARPLTGNAAMLRRAVLPLAGVVAARPSGSGGGARHGRSLAAAATGGGGKGADDKSWTEIAEEVAAVAKDVAGKVGKGVGALARALSSAVAGAGEPRREKEEERRLRRQQQEQQQQQQQQRERDLPAFPPQMFGGGLLGRVAAGIATNAARSLAGALEAQAREADTVRSSAEAALRASPELRARLGPDFAVGPPVSQASSTVSVNGRARRRVSLVLPLVDGRTGRATATARVDASPPPEQGAEGRGASAGGTVVLDAVPVDVVVTFATGETLRVGGGGGGGGARGGGGSVGAGAGGGGASAAGGAARRGGGGAPRGEVIDAEFKEL